jgi:transposase
VAKSRDKPPRHVMLFHYMLDSQAWKGLGVIPRAVYLDMAKRYYGTNNGRVGYSIRCAVAELHIGCATAKRALNALEERGFIVATKRGAFSLKQRHATEWRLTAYPCETTNGLATKDFMSWTPDKNKTRYLQRNQSVSPAEPVGICSGTREDSNTSHGICSGTVDPGIAA